MKISPTRWLLLVPLSWGMSCSAKASEATVQATPTVQSWVLYNADFNGNIEVFQLKQMSDGTSQTTMLTSGANTDWLNPKLSPDRTTIAVTRYIKSIPDDTRTDIKTVVTFPLAHPSQIKTIAGNATTPCEDPAWSPDGARLVYKQITGRNPFTGGIMEIAASGAGDSTLMTSDPFFTNRESSVPSYSRNDGGKRIVFQCFAPDSTTETTEHEQIFVVDRATKTPTQITTGPVKHWFPIWNPLLDDVVYIKNDLGAGAKLYRVDVATKAESLIRVPYEQEIGANTELVDPAFSPTGHLAFSARWNGKTGTYKLFEQGGNPTTLTALVATETVSLYGTDYIQSPP